MNGLTVSVPYSRRLVWGLPVIPEGFIEATRQIIAESVVDFSDPANRGPLFVWGTTLPRWCHQRVKQWALMGFAGNYPYEFACSEEGAEIVRRMAMAAVPMGAT